MSALCLDIGGASTLSVAEGTEPSLSAMVAEAFAPYGPATAPVATPSVSIESLADRPTFRDIEGRAGDDLVTAYDGSRAFVIVGRQACAIPDPLHYSPATFAFTPGFPIHSLLHSYVRTAAALTALRNDAVVVHASAVSIKGQGVLVGGWSESGKTEVALALAEAGAEFLSDKWTIVGRDGSLRPFPASVGVRKWVLPYLPRLRSALPRMARAQLMGAAAVSLASRPMQRPFRNPLLREVGSYSRRLAALADRAALSVAQVRAAYGTTSDPIAPVPLGLVVLLSTAAPRTRPATVRGDPEVVSHRLAQAAMFERRSYFSVTDRARYGGASEDRTDGPAVARIEEPLLRARLAGVMVLQVQAPFPSDPRRVVESIVAGGADCLAI
jgi:hypothetical protein